MNDEHFPASLEKVFEQLDDYLDYLNAGVLVQHNTNGWPPG